jgi:hypothetical protein
MADLFHWIIKTTTHFSLGDQVVSELPDSPCGEARHFLRCRRVCAKKKASTRRMTVARNQIRAFIIVLALLAGGGIAVGFFASTATADCSTRC